MMESMVDYVLERANQHYGEFLNRSEGDQNSALFNHRKLLEYLFNDNATSSFNTENQKRISDMKYEELSGQLNYFSQKMHAELVKKNISIDNDMYKVENEWFRKKMPDFYCYYFLKFTYANTYSRMHELFLSELENMSRDRDSYLIIKKTIEARQVCIANLRREIASISNLEIEESLESLRAERALKKKKLIGKEQDGYHKKSLRTQEDDEDGGKSWKNKIQLIFQQISHMRKLTAYVVELIKNWRNSIYAISEDPRRFRERVIFYHNDANYLLKTIFDNRFIFDSFLKKFLTFGNHYDPFLFKPCMVLQNKKKRTEDEEIFLKLIKPTELEMDKMTKALVILAEEEYDEDEQSRFLNERKNFGQLEHRKKYIEKRRDIMVSKSQSNLGSYKQKQEDKNRQDNRPTDMNFRTDKKSDFTQKQIEEVKMEKDEQMSKQKIESTANRLKKIRSVDLKKISPYLNRNERIAKAQKVLELEHKFRVAQNQYVQSVKKQKEDPKQIRRQWDSSQKQIINNRIFNKYIEENLKLIEQANKKAYIYKNKVSPQKGQSIKKNLNSNKVSFRDRKEAEYERNLEKYQRDDRNRSISEKRLRDTQGSTGMKNFQTKGTKTIIEISAKGIKSNENIVDFQQRGRMGKNMSQIVQSSKKAENMKFIQMKLNPSLRIERKKTEQQVQKNEQLSKSRARNLFEQEQKQQIIIMRQQPEKIEEIKQFLYVKIKEELLAEMKKNSQNKEIELNMMIEEEKRRKLNQIIEERRLEEQRKKQEEQRRKREQLQMQRKKIDFDIKIEPIQYSQENVGAYFDKIFEISPQTNHRLFLNQKVEQKKQYFLDQFYLMFLRGFLNGHQAAYTIVRYDWSSQTSRKLVIEYIAVNQPRYFISSFHKICEYLWNNDPVEHIQIVVFNNLENEEGKKMIEDLQEYANRRGQSFEKQLYSNIAEIKYVWARPKQYENIEFPFKNFYFGKLFNLKAELLSSAIAFNERSTPKIDMNLEIFTNYIFLLEELFRKYLTPEEVVELRENSTNIRRLKDIFRIVLELEKTNPVVNQLTVVQGLNLDDLYEKLKEKTSPPYDKYYWHHFYDKTLTNRLLLSILQLKLELQFPINSCHLDDRRFLRINPRRKVLVLRSSVYSRESIYVMPTNNPKIRMFLMDAENYKLMRIQLFVFLNLVFNNIVEDSEKFVNSFWFPQFVVNGKLGKEVKRITDFSITMKKSFFLSEEIYYANHEYIKNAISFLPKKSDVVYREAVIIGLLHTDVESGSTGMPIYAKMIDKPEMFTEKGAQ